MVKTRLRPTGGATRPGAATHGRAETPVGCYMLIFLFFIIFVVFVAAMILIECYHCIFNIFKHMLFINYYMFFYVVICCYYCINK